MNLVLTIAMGEEYNTIAKLTHPSIKAYAEKIGADFLSINEKAISKTTPHWEKFQIYHLLDKYDRIAYIDTDIIIRDDAPSLFDIVPETQLGMFNEAKFTDRSKELMIDICKSYGVTLDSWNGKYFNSGVIVLSKFHRTLFKKPEKEIFNFYEQSYLNMIIAKREVDMFELEHKFNRMTCVDQFCGEDRHASYMIHYAGIIQNSNLNFLLELIQKDLSKWQFDKKYDYKNYRNHIYVSVAGGIGDQLCAEPALRYLVKNMYHNDDVVIATHHPTFFKHLAKDNIEIIEHGNANLKPDTPYFIMETLPGPDKLQWSVLSHLLCNSTDYSSIATMKRTLPMKDKQIYFEISEGAKKSFDEKISHMTMYTDVSDYIVVHPGRHWDSKTFPSQYWQDIIDGLHQAGKKVCVIGKDEPGDPPFYIAGARGTVDLELADGIVDFRNLLTIDELAVLLSRAKVLISNDSFPIHLAGAFDNWIILLPSCKNPDYVLPVRNNNIYYKAKALYKNLVIDEVESRPTQLYETSAEFKVNDWDHYLLHPQEVINNILEI